MSKHTVSILLSLLRVSIGFIFLWAFFDKLLGLGFATEPNMAWIKGNSPTTGFLMRGTHGIFETTFKSLSNNVTVDILFMGGLLGVGISYVLGICLRIASYSGSLMMFLIYLSVFPPVNNPILDEHIIYVFVLLLIPHLDTTNFFSMTKNWQTITIVKKYKQLLA